MLEVDWLLLLIGDGELETLTLFVLLLDTLPLFVPETVGDLLLVTLAEIVADKVGVLVSVLLPVDVRETIPVIDVVELCETLPDCVATWLCVVDTLELADTVRVCFIEKDDDDDILAEPEGLFDADVVTESVYDIVCSDDTLERNDCDANELDVCVTDTVFVTPVGNVVGLAVNVFTAEPVAETETDLVLKADIE